MHRFYIPTELLSEETSYIFPIGETDVTNLLTQMNVNKPNQLRLSPHSFRRSLAVSIRVYGFKVFGIEKPADYKGIMHRINMILQWENKSQEFFKYTLDFKMHLTRIFVTRQIIYDYVFEPLKAALNSTA